MERILQQVSRYDTVDRIISNILIPLSKIPVEYKDEIHHPKNVRISSSIFKSLQCPVNCGGCCWKSVTLDWFPHEEHHPLAESRMVEFGDKQYEVMSIVAENPDIPCQFLDAVGRCNIYSVRPFLCDFSFIRIVKRASHYTMMNSTPSRGFHLKRVDGGKGNMCTMDSFDDTVIANRLRQFNSLRQIAEYFEMDTWVPEIITYLNSGKIHDYIDFKSPLDNSPIYDYIDDEGDSYEQAKDSR